MTWFSKKEKKSETSDTFKVKANVQTEQQPKKETFVTFSIELEILHPADTNVIEMLKNLEVNCKLPANSEITDSYIRRIQILENKPF